MTAVPWTQVSEAWDELLTLDAEARRLRLAEIAGESPALAAELRSLLDSGAAASFLDTPAAELADDARRRLETQEVDQRQGKRLGAYRLERLLGRGGMGAVYLAQRDDGQFEQQVALKLLPLGLQGDEWLRRFLDERQILARLQHPNIAPLLDGGIADDGTPFFVMPYIAGQSLDRYCDERTLPLRDRLSLFQQVCAAVAHAHRNLIVHRDIKPGNVLVDDEGVPKLLDFGIARIQSQASVPDSTRLVALTPDYAAPEHLTGRDISTLTDIYSLGALAYKLFAGRPPLALNEKSAAERESLIRHRIPAPPSRACVPGRGVEPAELRGDIDSIVLRCLRKEADERYGSVDALSDDIERYRSGFPVRAKAPTVGYRLGKFMQRHRIGVAAAGVVVFAMVLGISGVLWQARQTNIEARKSQRVAGFFAGMFDAANPFGQWREELTLQELLDRSAERAAVDLADEPEVRAEMLRLIGVAQTGLGRYGEGEGLLRTAEALQTELGLDAGVRAQTLLDLSTAQIEGGDYEAGAETARRAAALAGSAEDSAGPLLSDALVNEAVATSRLGDIARAEPLYRRALDIRRRVFDPGDYRIADAEASFAALLAKKGETGESLALNRSAVDIYDAALGAAHPLTVRARNGLAAGLFLSGNLQDAAAEFERLVQLAEERVGADHPESVLLLNNLGRVRVAMGEYDAAVDVLERAVDVARAALAQGHALRMASIANLGAARLEMGDVEAAKSLLDEAADAYRTTLGETHPMTVRTHAALAESRYWSGDADSALELARVVVEGRPAPGTRPSWLIDAHLVIARIHNDRGDPARALEHLHAAKVLLPDASVGEPRRAELALEKALAESEAAADLETEWASLAAASPIDHPRLARLRRHFP